MVASPSMRGPLPQYLSSPQLHYSRPSDHFTQKTRTLRYETLQRENRTQTISIGIRHIGGTLAVPINAPKNKRAVSSKSAKNAVTQKMNTEFSARTFLTSALPTKKYVSVHDQTKSRVFDLNKIDKILQYSNKSG